MGRVEKDALGDTPSHIPSRIPRGRRSEEYEYLFLYSGGEPVARAVVFTAEGLLSDEGKRENMRFIDGFLVLPRYRHAVGVLIDHCLSLLKGRGIRRVIVKPRGVPCSGGARVRRCALRVSSSQSCGVHGSL
jgi:hypothetical protein